MTVIISGSRSSRSTPRARRGAVRSAHAVAHLLGFAFGV